MQADVKKAGKTSGFYAVLALFVVFSALPFYVMLITSFTQQSELFKPQNNPFWFDTAPTLNHLELLFFDTHFMLWMWNTFILGLVVVAVTVVLVLPASYSLARLAGRWGGILGIGIFLTYLVPPTLLFLPLSKGPGEYCGPSAQHAVRQAKQLADNVVASLRGRAPKPYVHAYAGSVASLGLHQGVAQIYGVKLRGWPAWFIHRTYHVSRVPTVNRKVRVVADWTLALFFRREIVSLGALQNPREEFEFAARPPLSEGKLRPERTTT